MPKLSIVIPIYNEERTLPELLQRVLDVRIIGWEIEVVAVNDASSDKTPQILEKNKSRLKIHHHLKNQGKGTAVKNGLALATGDFLIIQDADLEYDPKEIPALVAAVTDNKTIVYGSRNLHHVKRRGFFVQRYGTWVTTKLINILYGAHLTDVWTCYKVFPAAAKNLYSGGKFESDIIFLVRTLRLGYRIIERPISHAPRGADEGKKIRYRDGIQAILLIIGDRLGHLRKEAEVKARDASSFIVDPEEHLPLKREDNVLMARNGARYSIDESGRPYLMSEASIVNFSEEHQSGINWLKSFFKQFPLLYYGIWHFFCPVLMLVNGPKNKFKKYVPAGTPIIDVGSGPRRFGDEFINLDIFPFPEVDIVADATHLPFADNSIPAIVSESVIEHVADPHTVTSEMMRVLKVGGYLYVSAPFIHPFHASPDDFNRWSISGLKHLFKDLEIVESGVRSGPVSALGMFLVYWFGVILSCGSKKVAPFITHVLMLVMGPLKFLDFLFCWMPGADAVACHLYIVAKKK
ncbi:MAG: glycosyltransferase [bacterium]|nr:glycosyltransferase [bacterium]